MLKYRFKIKEDHVFTISMASTQHIKVQRLVKYSYHICGDIGHMIIDCPQYSLYVKYV
jgi:hypothetical protein